MKAIETAYRGYRFRSRLEARWAVFFDALSIRWEYEPEGFELADGTRYLPDFYLPGFCHGGVYVEVKPERNAFDKARVFARESRQALLGVWGAPAIEEYVMWKTEGAFIEYPVCFHRKYLPGGRNAAEYRMYFCPESIGELDSEGLGSAIRAARGSRFEFGEHGGCL